MTVAYKSSGALFSSASTASASVAYPGSVAANDIAILVACGAASTPASSGFTFEAVDSSTGYYCILGWKRCAGTEGGTNATVTQSFSNLLYAQILLYSGCRTSGTPYEGYSENASSVFSAQLFSQAITSTFANNLGVEIAILPGAPSNAPPNFTALSGFTSRLDESVAGFALTAEDIANVSPTTNASQTWTSVVAFNTYSYVVFGLSLTPTFTVNNSTINVLQGEAVSLSKLRVAHPGIAVVQAQTILLKRNISKVLAVTSASLIKVARNMQHGISVLSGELVSVIHGRPEIIPTLSIGETISLVVHHALPKSFAITQAMIVVMARTPNKVFAILQGQVVKGVRRAGKILQLFQAQAIKIFAFGHTSSIIVHKLANTIRRTRTVKNIVGRLRSISNTSARRKP